MKPGQIIYIEEDKAKPYRPYLFLKSFKNNAGVIYNILCAPITTKDTIGKSNLVLVNGEELRNPSYAKISNLTTLRLSSLKYRIGGFIDEPSLKEVFTKLQKHFKI